MINNTTLKKILRDYNYLYESLIDVKDISSIAESEFREAMIQSGDNEALQALIPSEAQQSKLEEIKVEEEKELTHNDIDFKKLFRKIVIQCHPDKIKNASDSESEFLKECYENATNANDTYDWGLLIRVASKLEINLEGVNIQISEIKRKNEELQNEINKYENSMAFQWYTKDTKEQKQNFLQFCLGVFKGNQS
jgi:hypothetical protein